MKIRKIFFFSLFFVFFNLRGVQAKVALQAHQQIPIQYLEAHPEQKGMLLYHSLGSGKTYVALEYCEQFPNKKIVILMPHFLKANWVTQMASYGVQKPERYQFIFIENPEELLTQDLKDSIVVVDEVHRLIEKIRMTHAAVSEMYGQVYYQLKKAGKLLLLTGTPVFLETSDIAYLGNLLLEEEPYPIDAVKFKTEYMKIKPATSLVRGHFFESKWMMSVMPLMTILSAVILFPTSPALMATVGLTGGVIIPVANEVFPANQVAFREFDASKWQFFASHYISFYQPLLGDDENYPKKKIVNREVLYNEPQVNLFLNFIDQDMNVSEIGLMLADEKHVYSHQGLRFHSSKIQKQLLGDVGVGREIGNLDFEIQKPEGEKVVVESPKFMKILKSIQNQPGKIAIYSSYYQNGILRFARFLDRHGLKDQYLILDAKEAPEIQREVVNRYNNNEKRLILIHPDITEGISLMGTEQFHILEPVRNSALLEQIIGRAIRYRSHVNLPKERQKVLVSLWQSYVDYGSLLPTSAALTRRQHWQRKYAEINPSMWTKGITEVDVNYFLKDESPDQRVKRFEQQVSQDVKGFQELLKTFSVETTWKEAQKK